MNAPLPRQLPPEAEVALAAAVALIKAGADTEKVGRLLYELGYTSGALDMAATQQRLVSDAFRSML